MTSTREKYTKKVNVDELRNRRGCDLVHLGPQLIVHDADILQPKISPIKNDSKSISKPHGGLWTSTYDPHYGSGWVRWCVAYRYNDPLDLHWTLLSVASSAKVAVIDSRTDLGRLIDSYPRILRSRRGLDFETLSEEYDGLHLTHEGYLRTRSRRLGPALVGWDSESTLWFRCVFTDSHQVQPFFEDADRFDDMWLTLSGWSTEDYKCHRIPENKASRTVYDAMLREMAAGSDRWT